MTVAIALSALMCDGQHSSFTDVLDSIFSVTVGVVCLEYDGADVLPDKYKAVSVVAAVIGIYSACHSLIMP